MSVEKFRIRLSNKPLRLTGGISNESVFYESSSTRIEVEKLGEQFTWYQGKNNRRDTCAAGVVEEYEWHDLHDSLEDCLADAECELGTELQSVVSKDQRTPVRS